MGSVMWKVSIGVRKTEGRYILNLIMNSEKVSIYNTKFVILRLEW